MALSQPSKDFCVLTLRQTLASLHSLCQQEGIESADLAKKYPLVAEASKKSLTDEIAQIVSSSYAPMTAGDVRNELRKLGNHLEGQKNPLATIHAILSRLAKDGQVEEASSPIGPKAWRRRSFMGY